jgi:hypothetical protein
LAAVLEGWEGVSKRKEGRGRKTGKRRERRTGIRNDRHNCVEVYVGADDGGIVAAAVAKVSNVSQAEKRPYSSSVTRFNVGAEAAITFLPVADDPVNEILAMSGCFVIHGPRLSSPPSAWMTPGGKNCWASSASLRFE